MAHQRCDRCSSGCVTNGKRVANHRAWRFDCLSARPRAGWLAQSFVVARAVIIDCFSGASGDMLLGALLDAGLALDDLREGLGRLAVGGWTLDAESASQHGIGGPRARVRLAQTDQPHRTEEHTSELQSHSFI